MNKQDKINVRKQLHQDMKKAKKERNADEVKACKHALATLSSIPTTEVKQRPQALPDDNRVFLYCHNCDAITKHIRKTGKYTFLECTDCHTIYTLGSYFIHG